MTKYEPKSTGNIEISEDVIATLAGSAAIECYGLAGMASKSIVDGFAELLRRESLHKGVIVTLRGQEIDIDLYIIVNYGVKISEVANNVRDRVRFFVENATGLTVRNVNINVQGVQLN